MNLIIQKSACGLVAITLLITLAFSFGSQARAQGTSAQLEQIETLLAMIEKLQAQLAELRGESGDTKQCLQLSHSLYLGISDRESRGEVSKLQRFLTNTGHYTYGETTGYYGPATQRAVQAWQAANDVISSGSPETTGYGVVGPSTKNALARGCASKPSVKPPIDVEEEKEKQEDVRELSVSNNPATITSIQAKASADGELYAGVKASVYGTGLKGDLIIKLGHREPKYVEVTSTSDTYAEFIVPEYSQTTGLSVKVINSSGEMSEGFSVRVKASPEDQDTDDTATITDIVAKASDDGEIFAGERAYIYGTGLGGDLTIKLGNREPKYVEVTSTSDTSAEFVVPEYNQTTDVSVKVTNSSGEESESYNVTVRVY